MKSYVIASKWEFFLQGYRKKKKPRQCCLFAISQENLFKSEENISSTLNSKIFLNLNLIYVYKFIFSVKTFILYTTLHSVDLNYCSVQNVKLTCGAFKRVSSNKTCSTDRLFKFININFMWYSMQFTYLIFQNFLGR